MVKIVTLLGYIQTRFHKYHLKYKVPNLHKVYFLKNRNYPKLKNKKHLNRQHSLKDFPQVILPKIKNLVFLPYLNLNKNKRMKDRNKNNRSKHNKIKLTYLVIS